MTEPTAVQAQPISWGFTLVPLPDGSVGVRVTIQSGVTVTADLSRDGAEQLSALFHQAATQAGAPGLYLPSGVGLNGAQT